MKDKDAMTDQSNPNDDRYERFVRLFTRHEPDLRAFLRSLLPTQHDADEVMQELSLVAWRKFDQLDEPAGFIRWASVIARFEAMKYRRQKGRDRLIFDEQVIGLLADEFERDAERRRAERQALESCLGKLPERERRLVLQAYAPGQSIRELAESLDQQAGTLYKLLRRLRQQLLVCIRQAVALEGHA